MTRYFVGRLLQALPVLFGVSVIAFLPLRRLPGDPALAILGDRATPESLARLQHELPGLDRSLVEQYLLFVSNALHGQFGTSATYRTDVGPLTFARVPVSMVLIVYASVIALLITIPMATLAASRRGGPVDQAVRLLFTVILGVPAFWRASSSRVSGRTSAPLPRQRRGKRGHRHPRHLFLPALTIALAMSPILVRSLRSSLVEVIDADFVTTGQAMGLPRGVILRSYLLRNAILPVILVLSINVAWLLGGTVIAEQVFSIPGVGSLLISSIGTRDYAIIQLIALLFAILVLIVNLVTDLLFAFLDPRIKLA